MRISALLLVGSATLAENHLRAVLGLPLGPTDARGPSLMLNGHTDINALTRRWRRDPWTRSWPGTTSGGRITCASRAA